MKRAIWKQLILDSNVHLSAGGAALAGYCELIVHGDCGYQVMLMVFLFFMNTYAWHAFLCTHKKKESLGSIKLFWTLQKMKMIQGVLIILWVTSFFIIGLKAIVLFIMSCCVPMYTLIRVGSSKMKLKSFGLFKLIFSSCSILSVLSFSIGDVFEDQKIALAFLIFHLCCNIVIGDLRDIEHDKEVGGDSLGVRFGFYSVKLTLLGILAFLAMMSFATGEVVWSLTFLINFLILFRCEEKQESDRYHVFDVSHYIPLLGSLTLTL